MTTKEFNQLEAIVVEIMAQIKDARETYLQENWLSDVMYRQVFLEKIKEMKKAIDEAIENDVL